MAHGFVSYSQPKYGLDLGAMVAGKIKDSFGMAAEERRLRDEEIAKLEGKNKEDRTAEESKRLEELLEQKKSRTEGRKRDRVKNSFFTKAMMSQFGGDRKRRLQGMLSNSPKGSQDPSLTKEQRYSALLDESMAAPGEAPPAPDDIDPLEYGDAVAQTPTPQQSGLEKALGRVSEALSIISSKVSSLKAEEAKSKATSESRLAKFNGVFESIKNYFDRDNDLKKTENTIEQQKIENFRDAQADAKAAKEQAATDKTEDLSNFEDTIDNPEKKGGGLLGGIMDGVKGLFKNFMGGGKKGAAKGVTGYSKPIGPQPMNSSTPWAKMGAGDRGGMFGGGQFTPRMSATKLSEGGIVDNPTVTNLNPGDSVIPLNRNNAVANVFKGAGEAGGKLADPMTQVMQLPTKVGGGLLVSLLAQVANKLGGLSGLLKPLLSGLAKPIASMFGLPATIISTMLGGAPAAAATMGDGLDISKLLGGNGLKIPGMSSPKGTPGAGPAAAPNLAGTGVVNEVSGSGLLLSASQGGHSEVGVTSKFGNRESPGGVGSTNHQGVDIGTSGQKGYKVAFKRGGTVTHAGTAGGFGNLVIIKDEDGTEYYFGHLANINPDIKVGAEYTGQTIGEIGNTGTGTGEHLHFEKHPNGGAAVDPINDIGLLSIGKQTQALPSTDAPVVDLANLNKPEPQTPSIDTSALEESGPALAALIKANQQAQQQTEQPELTVPGLSGLPIYDPTRLDSSYLFAF